MLIQNVRRPPLAFIDLHSVDDELLARGNQKASLKAMGPKEETLEAIRNQAILEADVTAISWEVAAVGYAEDASITTTEELGHAT